MPADHESIARLVEQNGAFATHRFGDEGEGIFRRVEGGGVELYELHVGQSNAGAMGDGVAVTGGDHGVGGIAVNLPASTCGEDGGVGTNFHCLPAYTGPHTGASPLFDNEVEHARPFQHAGPLARLDSLDKGARHFGAGAVAVRMDNAAAGVRGLAPKLESAVGAQIEGRARQLQLADSRGAFFDQHLHRFAIAQGGAGRQRIFAMQLRRVAGAERGGDSALGVGGGAVEKRTFGEHEHVALLRNAPRRVEPGHAATNHEDSGTKRVHSAAVPQVMRHESRVAPKEDDRGSVAMPTGRAARLAARERRARFSLRSPEPDGVH